MSDLGKPTDPEDVLSSIRRLVAQDPAVAQVDPVPEAERLMLAPALRVGAPKDTREQPDPGPEAPMALDVEPEDEVPLHFPAVVLPLRAAREADAQDAVAHTPAAGSGFGADEMSNEGADVGDTVEGILPLLPPLTTAPHDDTTSAPFDDATADVADATPSAPTEPAQKHAPPRAFFNEEALSQLIAETLQKEIASGGLEGALRAIIRDELRKVLGK
ncbi:hypothetical protein ERN12_10085 [Rhodobacteraceae bacterium]|nr:hypothetical protein ERN12_10085 [Paracoccaceae bacterium]